MAKKKDTEVAFNVSTHVLVPKHELCSDTERKRVVQQYSVTDQQLPRIPFIDPAIQHLGAKEGDLIKISRESATAGHTVFYRIVSAE